MIYHILAYLGICIATVYLIRSQLIFQWCLNHIKLMLIQWSNDTKSIVWTCIQRVVGFLMDHDSNIFQLEVHFGNQSTSWFCCKSPRVIIFVIHCHSVSMWRTKRSPELAHSFQIQDAAPMLSSSSVPQTQEPLGIGWLVASCEGTHRHGGNFARVFSKPKTLSWYFRASRNFNKLESCSWEIWLWMFIHVHVSFFLWLKASLTARKGLWTFAHIFVEKHAVRPCFCGHLLGMGGFPFSSGMQQRWQHKRVSRHRHCHCNYDYDLHHHHHDQHYDGHHHRHHGRKVKLREGGRPFLSWKALKGNAPNRGQTN